MATKGIDVSYNQKNIDWAKVKADGVKYAIIRCGYGMDIKNQDDTYYKRNVDECVRLGIPFGIYLFSYANTVDKAKSEAEHVLRLVKGYKPSLGIWYDIEDNNTSGSVSKSTLTNIINTFCEKIATNGYYVGVYANLNWLNNKIDTSIKNKYPIWVAQYNSKCQYTGKYVIWQYTSSGKVNGISGNVDMNYLYDDNLLTSTSNTTTGNTSSTNTDAEKDRIKSLQTALNKDFKLNLSINGIMEPQTEKAVKSHYLKYFTSGEFVGWVQTNLIRKGYSVGSKKVDKKYGKDTEAGVKKYQKDKKLTIDGCAGIQVVKSLLK